jgi:hypothetical protein
MQEKTIHIPFNRTHYINNQKVVWGLMYKSVSGSYYIYIAATVIVLSIGLAVDLKGGFPITTIIGTGMLISILLRLRHVYKVKQNFFNRANDIANEHETEFGDYYYTFTDESLTCRNNLSSVTLSWKLFEPVTYFENTLILKLKKSEDSPVLISAYETSHDDFQKIYGILKEKIGEESPISN